MELSVAQKIKNFDENYPEIKENIKKISEQNGKSFDDVILLAATKTVEAEVINHAADCGLAFMGENRVQEFLSKNNDITPNLHRHFIGHLQTNKVADIITKVEMIHSVHSVKLAEKISKEAIKNNLVMDILLEVNIGREESKSGFMPEEVEEALETISKLDGVAIKGLMAIPPICETDEICQYFEKMQKMFIDIRAKNSDNINMVYLSMGMSDDYQWALKYGANIVRIGSSLFGKRYYANKEN